MTSFDIFIGAFLNKVTQYDFVTADDDEFFRQADDFLLATCADFDRIFRRRVNLTFANRDRDQRYFNWDFPSYEEQMEWGKPNKDYISFDEVVDIISEGMIIRWMNGFLFSGDNFNLGNFLNTRDFQVYSPSAFISSLNNMYQNARAKYKQMVDDFQYNHADLSTLHM